MTDPDIDPVIRESIEIPKEPIEWPLQPDLALRPTHQRFEAAILGVIDEADLTFQGTISALARKIDTEPQHGSNMVRGLEKAGMLTKHSSGGKFIESISANPRAILEQAESKEYVTSRVLGRLAIHENVDAKLQKQALDAIESQDTRIAERKRPSMAKNKNMTFQFMLDDKLVSASMPARIFVAIEDPAHKLLLGLGQSSGFAKTEKDKIDFITNLLNKGINKADRKFKKS